MRISFEPTRLFARLARRVRERLRGETAATFFDPFSRHDLTRLLAEFDIPVPSGDPRKALTWEAARSAFDRVREVYELRADVREVFPLGLTPAQRGQYAAWLLRYGRAEYGLTADEILGYLFALAEDRSCGLGDTYLLSPEWQRAVPDALTESGWKALKTWLAKRYPIRVGRWLRRASRPVRFQTFVSSDASRTINLLGHFKYESGLQEEVTQQAATLERLGFRTCLRDVPVSYPRDFNNRARFTDLELGDTTIVKLGAQLPLDEAYQRAGLHPRPGVYRILCWSWELEEFPREAVARAGLANEIWAVSEFCAESIRRAMPGVPVFAMPTVARPHAFEPRPRSHFGLPDERFLFLFAFDMASGMERKNPLGLIRAFRKAFSPSESVHLALKVSRGHDHPADFARLCREAEAAGATIIDRVMPRSEVQALLANCDSYVSLHRSEGLGLTMAETMLLGKPTIATGYSGNLDFMTATNSFLVHFDRVKLDRDYPPYPRGCTWAEPSVEHAASLMRWVYENREEAATIAKVGQATVAALLSPAAAAQRMAMRLAEIRRP